MYGHNSKQNSGRQTELLTAFDFFLAHLVDILLYLLLYFSLKDCKLLFPFFMLRGYTLDLFLDFENRICHLRGNFLDAERAIVLWQDARLSGHALEVGPEDHGTVILEHCQIHDR